MTPQTLIRLAPAILLLALGGPARAEEEPTVRQACLQSKKSAPTWKANCEMALANARVQMMMADLSLTMFSVTLTPQEERAKQMCQNQTGNLAEIAVSCENARAWIAAEILNSPAARQGMQNSQNLLGLFGGLMGKMRQ